MKSILPVSCLLSIVLFGNLVGGSGRVEAAFATYTETVVGSGSLGGVAFTNQLITLTQTADTTNVTLSSTSIPFYSVQAVTSTISLAGFATASFIAPTFVGSQSAPPLSGSGLGQMNVGGPSLISITSRIPSNYDLKSSLGPVTGSSLVLTNFNLATTTGNFVITAAANTATFQARVGAVPEPSSLALVSITALGGLGAWTRRRISHAI